MASHTIFLPGKFHGQRSLASYSPWGCKEFDMTKTLETNNNIVMMGSYVFVWHWKWKLKLLCHVQLFGTPWTIQSIQFSRTEYLTFPISRVSSQLRDRTQVSLQVDSLLARPQGKLKNTGVGSLSLLQRIVPTQESNWDLLHCRWILYQLNYQESPCRALRELKV